MSGRLIALAALLLLAAGAQIFAWSAFHRPVHPADVPAAVTGLSFSPFTRNQDSNDPVTRETLREELSVVATKATSVRTYAVTGGLENVPQEAAYFGLDVTLGVWMDAYETRNARERENAIALANAHGNVTRILVGNEAIYREDASVDAVIAAMDEIRGSVSIPVGTAEPWHVWLAHPELAEHADFLGVHILPYWEGIAAEDALSFVAARLEDLRTAFPGKPIVLAEMGWPSDGARIGDAVPSLSNQALVVRDFAAFAERAGLEDYFLVEAFDQPWKKDLEGLAGGYWGIFDTNREAKFAWTGPVENRTNWPPWAALGALIGFLPLGLGLRLRPNLSLRAAVPLIGLGQIAGAMLSVMLLLATERYFDGGDWALWATLLAGELLLFLVLTIEAIEAAALISKRSPDATARPVLQNWPKVSIHVPCCNEPPELVARTLNALSRLDYTDFEVIVVDNNTSDLSTSAAIAAHCSVLGPRFRFLHLPQCAGFKAGALNRALQITAPDAALIGVIDSDYVVSPNWLHEAVPHFSDAQVGIAQAPQDYRDGNESAFKRGVYWEYRAFFRLGMVFRAEDNAIIQHGTMTLIRREALQNAGAWDENCITEDAELGLRLFADGWKAAYITETLGRGLMPDDKKAYGGQRFRWAFGAMQILRRHARVLFGRTPSKLSFAQRYHFVAGWLPWIGDGAGLIVAGGSIVWAGLASIWPAHFEPPEAHFLIPALAVFAARQARLWWLYGRFVEKNPMRRVGAMIAGSALSFTVAQAVIGGIVRGAAPFRRTPKAQPAPRLFRSLRAVRAEATLLGGLCFAAIVLIATQNTARLDVQLWFAVIGLQAWPYLAAIILSLQASAQKPVDLVREEPVPAGAGFREAAE
jgi:exo-beta-1,3-glucanase (GH17 family)/glycosyltransferase involved in cell wall biosynthesis